MEIDHLLCINGHKERIWSVSWSPSEDLFATSSSDCKVKIWRFYKSTKKPRINRCILNYPGCGSEYSYELEFEISNFFKKTVRSVKFSKDGNYLICASFDGTSTIWSKKIHDKSKTTKSKNTEWKCLVTLEGHENEVKCASFDSSGNYVATCGRDKTIWIYEKSHDKTPNDCEDLNKLHLTGKLDYFCSAILTGHTHDVKYVCWNPVALILASASYDSTIRIWTIATGDWSCIQTLNLHTNTVWCLSFNSNGTKLTSCSSDKSLFVYKSKIIECFSKFGKIAKPRLNRFTIFNTCFPVPNIKKESESNSYGPVFADDWEVCKAYEELHSRPIYTVDFGDYIVTGGGDNKIKIINLEDDFSNIHEISAHTSDVNAVSWKPNDSSKILVSVGDDEYIRIWKEMSGLLNRILFPGIVPLIQSKVLSLPLPEKLKSILAHPAGPFTIHFYAPSFKWSISLANISDINRPTHLISLPQQLGKEYVYSKIIFNLAVTATGLIWSRYSYVIIPRNYNLLSVNLAMSLTGLYQISRIARDKYLAPQKN
ncbi:wd40-repeat protein, putative [Theileria annulata]|uniref:Probable cytosolic iron-sulfur protein assembly protein CIAO1 homolog n=1 Tax=Theileria annulata TaxID=5874 RepID=Q4UB51_THEAN|nr:wd40-repeat protein, putative [Theileria annulata]CAI75950.1 wd40-repeat protein, putative [Theileria annulata]|eukprot:XP_955426.1 wd40-repeat protein, putative [Theileria annulata]